jgi:tetratricopeptide (TPR) repeat protein
MLNVRRVVFVLMLLAAALLPVRADSVSEVMEQGNAFFALGQYEMAIFQYRAALPLMSSEQAALAHYNIGACYYQLRQPSSAVTEFREAIKIRAGRYPKASYALGLALRELGRWTEAREAFTLTAQQAGERQTEALMELGIILARDGDYQAAISRLRQALKQRSRYLPQIHNNLGVILALNRQPTEALEQFDLALKRSGGRLSEASHNLQLCHRLLDGDAPRLIAELKLTGQAQSTY